MAPDIPPVVAMLNSEVTSIAALPVLGAHLMVAKAKPALSANERKTGEAARHGGGGNGVQMPPKGGFGPGPVDGGVPKGAIEPKLTAPSPKGPIHVAKTASKAAMCSGRSQLLLTRISV